MVDSEASSYLFLEKTCQVFVFRREGNIFGIRSFPGKVSLFLLDNIIFPENFSAEEWGEGGGLLTFVFASLLSIIRKIYFTVFVIVKDLEIPPFLFRGNKINFIPSKVSVGIENGRQAFRKLYGSVRSGRWKRNYQGQSKMRNE